MVNLDNNPDEDIFVKTQQYLDGGISHAELYEWVVPWIQHFSTPKLEEQTRAGDLVSTFLLATYESSDGLITEEELKETLRAKFFSDNPTQGKER